MDEEPALHRLKTLTLGPNPRRRSEKCRETQVSEFVIAPRFAYDDLGSPPLVPPEATLIFEVELVGFENKSDVLGDGRAMKTILQRGQGPRARLGQDVAVSVRVTARKGQVLQEARLEHRVGHGDFGAISPILSEVLQSMCSGERCSVLLRRFAGDQLVDSAHSGAEVALHLERIYETLDVSPQQDVVTWGLVSLGSKLFGLFGVAGGV